MAKVQPPSSISEFPLSLVKNMVSLATSGFGVVVALAWNELIQEAVTKLVSPYLGANSGLVAMLLYAITVTTLAVIVTMQLTGLERKLELIQEQVAARRAAKSVKK